MTRQISIVTVVPALILAFCPSSPAARTIQVSEDGSGDAPGIQAGIDMSANGDTVLVGPGQYLENLRFHGKNISVLSISGPELTIIDGSANESSCVLFIDGEGPGTLLRGFTLTNGRGSPRDGVGGYGGAILIDEGAPSILNNIIVGNQALASSGGGGGIWCSRNSFLPPLAPRIEGNQIIDNQADLLGGGIGVEGNSIPQIIDNDIVANVVLHGDGGGICAYSRSDGILITGNRIARNVAEDHGGGIYVGPPLGIPLVLEISWNLIAANEARAFENTGDSGGGVWLHTTDSWVHHNTIVGNSGFGGDGTWGGGLILSREGAPLIELNIIALSLVGGGVWCGEGVTPTIRNNLAWANAGGNGVGKCSTWWQTDGNIVADPFFCDTDAGNYQLAEDSPALTHPAGPLGAFPTPGCTDTPTLPTTWGRLKNLYRP